MPGRRELAPIPRVALSREDAAASLGMSLDSFERYVQPHVRIIRLGRMRRVAVAELEDWGAIGGRKSVGPAGSARAFGRASTHVTDLARVLTLAASARAGGRGSPETGRRDTAGGPTC
jgi:hypothetical protein